jgi:multiple sugar transport system permease protein
MNSNTFRKIKKTNISTHLILIMGVIITFFPFIWLVSTSLTASADVFSWPPKLIPDKIMFSNYIDAIESVNYFQCLKNSLIVSISTTILALTFNTMAGYALAKLHFPGRNIIFYGILATLMIPPQLTVIPLFLMFRGFPLAGGNDLLGEGGRGIINTYFALILPGMASTFGVYMMREFFRMMPNELLDAARIDGATEFGIFTKVYLPLARPPLVAVGIFTFTYTWNDFFWPLIMTSTPEMYTLTLGINMMKSQYFLDWNLLMAVTVLTIIPVLIIYAIFQRNFIQGMAMSGIKG